MRKLVSHTILTLDGVAVFDAVADTIGQLRDTEEVLSGFFSRVAEEDTLLMGRVTYCEWSSHWPPLKGHPFADHINRVEKFVLSTTLSSAPWGEHPAATVIRDMDAIRALKRQPGRSIGVHGSPTLVESLLHADLLDEMRLEIYPVVAGAGARLFHDGQAPRRLELTSSQVTSQGVAILGFARPTVDTHARAGGIGDHGNGSAR